MTMPFSDDCTEDIVHSKKTDGGGRSSSFRLVLICLALSGVGTFTLSYVTGDSLTHSDHELLPVLILIRILM